MSTMTPSVSPNGPIDPLLISWNEAEGRTIKSVTQETVAGCYSEILVFRFTDGSGLVLHGNDDGQYWGEPDALSGNYDDKRRRVHLGLLSREEYVKAEAERRAQDAADAVNREHALFERLKRKYEG